MKVLVSACLLGENCKYNGRNNENPAVLEFVRGKEVLPVCPEILSGLGCPRPCVELRDGVAFDQNGRNVDAQFRLGVRKALEQLESEEIDLAVLQSRSPTCGVKEIYDGSFTGKKIPGMGLLAKALTERGVRVVDAADIASFPAE